MQRRSNNFKELNSFKGTLRREKHTDLPSFEGVSVTLPDLETGIDFDVPVLLVKDMRPCAGGTVIRLLTGEKCTVRGDVQEVCHKIIKAKIEGGHD